MSLYEGLDIGGDDKTGVGGGWSSAGLKLLQSQIQLKKATLTQRDKAKVQVPVSSSVAPVIDLSNRNKQPSSEGEPFKAPPAETKPATSLLKPRKPLVFDGPPLSFIPLAAKEDKILIFGEIAVEDEYNPMIPNDFEKVIAEREVERRKQREEERRRDIEERDRRRRERAGREQEEEEIMEHHKRITGAAIAPPPSLMEEDMKVYEEPAPGSAFTPDFGSGSKGLGVAAKIMEKYGYKQGSGLGRQSQGMSTALQVTKTSLRGGKIFHEKDMAKEILEEESYDSPPPPSISTASAGSSDSDGFVVPEPPAPTAAPQLQPAPPVPELRPITEVLKNPTKLILLKNMVGPGEVDNYLEPEVKEEMAKYGEVLHCLIYEMPPPTPETEAVRIFVEFAKVDQAIKAAVDLNGRYFGGRLVNASFYDPGKFSKFELTD